MRIAAMLGLITLSAVAVSAATSPPHAPLSGTWRGTSECTDLVAAPACKDEIVIYRFTPSGRDSALLKAYKVVGGEELFMGDMTFGRDTSTAQWVAEFHGRRGVARWTFRVADTVLTGRCVQLPGGEQVRRVRVVRAAR